MKIKLLREIPWCGYGNILETEDGFIRYGSSELAVSDLFRSGWAEEVKE